MMDVMIVHLADLILVMMDLMMMEMAYATLISFRAEVFILSEIPMIVKEIIPLVIGLMVLE